MDGVLIDSASAVERAWTKFADEHGLDFEVVLAQTHGRRTAETVRAVAPHLNAESVAAIMEGDEVRRAAEVIALPGVADLLGSLPDGSWGIVTSATRPLASARLEANGLTVPAVLVTAEDVRHGKPNPEGYATGAKLLGIPASQCVVFEDAPPGIEAARRAGARVIGVATTFPREQLTAAEAVVESLASVSIDSARGRLVVRIHD
jgi:sugar-phosphatase